MTEKNSRRPADDEIQKDAGIPKDTDILCVGNVLVDIFAEDGGDISGRYGITRPVQHIEIETLHAVLAELSASEPPELPKSGAAACRQENPSLPVFVSGGGAANAAKIAGFLGAKVSFTGAAGSFAPAAGGTEPRSGSSPACGINTGEAGASQLGTLDSFGRFFAQSLAAAGVKLSLAVKTPPSGICLMLKRGDETRVAASPSASLELSEGDISGEEIRRAKVVVIDGFMLERRGLVRHILSLAEKYGTAAAIDLGSASIAREKAREIAEYAARYPLILFMNEAEAAAFREAGAFRESFGTGEENPMPKGPREGFPIVVVKLGEKGALCFQGESVYKAETQAVVPVEATGAGDAFCAAFLTAWVRGRTLKECAALGNKAAGIVLGAAGTQLDGERLRFLAGLIGVVR